MRPKLWPGSAHDFQVRTMWVWPPTPLIEEGVTAPVDT